MQVSLAALPTSHRPHQRSLIGNQSHFNRKFNQETNNKLIECRNCKYMFHQLCHRPPLAHDELEEQYISKCFECMSPQTDNIELVSSSAASAHVLDEPKETGSHSKESSTAVALLNSPGGNGTVKGQQLFAMKGLAALATKFSPAQTPTAAASKNNDLFNKFKQSASSPASESSSPSSSLLLLGKNNSNKNPFIQLPQPVSLTASQQQQQQQQQKRNIFNIASTASGTANAIPVTVATPTGDKRAK